MARVRNAERRTGVTEEGFQFSKIVGSTGVERFVLRKSSATPEFRHFTSMRLLGEAGLVAVDQDLEIPILVANRQLQRTLTNNGKYTWFYTLGHGPLNLPQFQHVESGVLVSGMSGKREATIRNEDGPKPLSLLIRSDYGTRCSGWHFVRNAYGRPSNAAPVVYGKLADSQVQAGREATARKVGLSLAHVAREVLR